MGSTEIVIGITGFTPAQTTPDSDVLERVAIADTQDARTPKTDDSSGRVGGNR